MEMVREARRALRWCEQPLRPQAGTSPGGPGEGFEVGSGVGVGGEVGSGVGVGGEVGSWVREGAGASMNIIEVSSKARKISPRERGDT